MGFVDLLRKMVYADDLVKIAQKVFKKHGRWLDTRERS